jgi:hypothetical protein
MQNRVLVKPVNAGWVVETSAERLPTLALKNDAVKLGRQAAKALPGVSLLLILKRDGSVESATEYGSDRPPPSFFSIGAKPA